MNKIGLIITMFFLFLSCQSSQKESIEKINQIWIGRKIIIPDNVIFKTLGQDTLCSDLWDKPYKIFTYIDSVGCTSCQMNLPEWKAKIQLCRQQQIDIGFIFVVHSSNFRRFEEGILMSFFDYPIIYDYHNKFENINHFLPISYTTFLLDKDNKVLLVGSPINNRTMWDLYKRAITKHNY